LFAVTNLGGGVIRFGDLDAGRLDGLDTSNAGPLVNVRGRYA
jgi:hypothetical protein